jgi:hypothetical protein
MVNVAMGEAFGTSGVIVTIGIWLPLNVPSSAGAATKGGS